MYMFPYHPLFQFMSANSYVRSTCTFQSRSTISSNHREVLITVVVKIVIVIVVIIGIEIVTVAPKAAGTVGASSPYALT